MFHTNTLNDFHSMLAALPNRCNYSGFYLFLGEKIRVEIDGGWGSVAEGRCSLGGLGACPPEMFSNLEPSKSDSEAFSRQF